MDYLKLFQNHSEYEAFVSGGTMMKPNVSHCVSENDVHYNAMHATYVIATFNVTTEALEEGEGVIRIYGYPMGEEWDDESQIPYGVNMFNSVEIDGNDVSIISLDNMTGNYPLTEGMHTIKYEIKEGYFSNLREMFFACYQMESVVLPSNLTSIGRTAFYDCNNLTSVTIPDSVTSIGDAAFNNCTDLTSVTIGNSVTSIGEGAFRYSQQLTNINIPNSITHIGDYAFEGCSQLDSATRSLILAINDNAFGDEM